MSHVSQAFCIYIYVKLKLSSAKDTKNIKTWVKRVISEFLLFDFEMYLPSVLKNEKIATFTNCDKKSYYRDLIGSLSSNAV